MLGAAVVAAALTAGAAAPAQAQTPTEGATARVIICTPPTSLIGKICTGSSQTVCVPPDLTTETYCVSRNGYDVCLTTGPCITGIGSKVSYILEQAGPYVDLVNAKVGEAQAEVAALQAEVNAKVAELQAQVNALLIYVQQQLQQPICVAPLDPTRPICITP